MKLVRWLLVPVLLQSSAWLSGARAASDTDSPAVVVQALYKVDLKHFGFDETVLKADRPYLAPDLYARLLKKANQPVAPGDAPDIEGDVIFNAQDMPTHYVVGKASIDQASAQVGVDLAWDSDKRHYTVRLQQINGAWKVTDIDFGQDGKLTDLLK
jgi:hypothetical protein